VVGGLVTGGIECRGAVSAQTVGVLQEHQVQPRKLPDAVWFSLALWSQLFNWRAALVIVKPQTLIGWHRQGFKLFWRSKSRLGRPRIPENLRQLIVRMVQENPTRREERIAAELSVKLGILVSPGTVRAYWPQDSDPRGGRRTSSQHWRTFVRNHHQPAKIVRNPRSSQPRLRPPPQPKSLAMPAHEGLGFDNH
jgi:putative transposase